MDGHGVRESEGGRTTIAFRAEQVHRSANNRSGEDGRKKRFGAECRELTFGCAHLEAAPRYKGRCGDAVEYVSV